MASSRLMSSSSPANSELARQSSSYSPPAVTDLQGDGAGEHPGKGLGPMIVDDIFRNIYPDAGEGIGGEGSVSVSVSRQGSFAPPKMIGEKTVEEVWREITAGRRPDGSGGGEYGLAARDETLEDFLTRSGMENVARHSSGPSQGSFGASPTVADQLSQHHQQFSVENPALGFGNESGGRGGRGTRGAKRPLLDPMDKAALQRQKRMIKNRESAARSRERKQAYTAELESLVAHLEEENAQLLRAQKMQQRERLKQLMDNLVPVTESRKPKQHHRRTLTMEW